MAMLKNKSALVTGGSSGIGLAVARRFAAEGARVAITGRRVDVLDDAVRAVGTGTIGIVADSASLEDHDRVASRVADSFGKLDIYMANAGINTIRNSGQVDEAEYDAQFAVNARGVFFGVQKMVPLMADGGAIILTGSLASERNLDGHAVYAGSKAAIGAFARSWAIELKDRRIRVNLLSPGPVDTEILGKLGIPPEGRDEFEAQMAAAIPLGRLGRPDELASAALFLASDQSSFVTGVNLRVDGGMALL